MLLDRALVKSYRADLASGEVTLALSLGLNPQTMAARVKIGNWKDCELPLDLELTPHDGEQLPLLDIEEQQFTPPADPLDYEPVEPTFPEELPVDQEERQAAADELEVEENAARGSATYQPEALCSSEVRAMLAALAAVAQNLMSYASIEQVGDPEMVALLIARARQAAGATNGRNGHGAD
jgi:hypothetical protein